jgi:hypothetical protein
MSDLLVLGGAECAAEPGIVWTAPDHETLRRVVPGGDPALGRALVDGFGPAVEWACSSGVFVSERWEGQMGFGSAVPRGRRGTVRHLAGMNRCSRPPPAVAYGGAAAAARHGRPGGGRGRARPPRPSRTGSACRPARDERLPGRRRAAPALPRPDADAPLVRSNPGSVGDGFRMAADGGAAASRCLGGFFGHLVPKPALGLESRGLPAADPVLIQTRGSRQPARTALRGGRRAVPARPGRGPDRAAERAVRRVAVAVACRNWWSRWGRWACRVEHRRRHWPRPGRSHFGIRRSMRSRSSRRSRSSSAAWR